MSNYIRVFLDGHYYFLTVLINDRKLSLLTDYIEEFRKALKVVKAQYSFELYAISIMPDHFHMIILPETSKEYPINIACIKRNFTNSLDDGIRQKLAKDLSPSKIKKGESGVWHGRFYEHTIRSQEELNHITDYIHYNPVKHGYVNAVKDWKYSSFLKFVAKGHYDKNWCDFTESVDYG